MLTAPTANTRWRLKPCTECGTKDWMFGTKHRCADCQAKRTGRGARPVPKCSPQKFPPDAVEKIRKMRALGGTWEVIAIPFDCDWQVVRNFFLSNCGPHDKRKLRLAALLRVAEGEFA